MNSKVSIMIPTYNQAGIVSQAIESALNQTYTNIEIVISDDSPNDETGKLVKKYLNDPRVHYFKNNSTLGRVKNYRDTLYNKVTGDYVLNIDGDDYLIDRNYIADAVKILDENPEVSLVFAKINYLFKDGKQFEGKTDSTISTINDGNSILLSYFQKFFIPHLASLYRRKDAMEIDFYSLDQTGCDLDSLLRLLVNHKVGFINRVVGIWRKHDQNASQTLSVKSIIGNLEIVDNVYKFAIKKKPEDTNIFKKWRMKALKRFVIKALLKAQFTKKIDSSELKKAIYDYDRNLYKAVMIDPYYLVLRIIFMNKFLAKFLLVNILSLESMYLDLMELKNE